MGWAHMRGEHHAHYSTLPLGSQFSLCDTYCTQTQRRFSADSYRMAAIKGLY